jgi:hypothetical protein
MVDQSKRGELSRGLLTRIDPKDLSLLHITGDTHALLTNQARPLVILLNLQGHK